MSTGIGPIGMTDETDAAGTVRRWATTLSRAAAGTVVCSAVLLQIATVRARETSA